MDIAYVVETWRMATQQSVVAALPFTDRMQYHLLHRPVSHVGAVLVTLGLWLQGENGAYTPFRTKRHRDLPRPPPLPPTDSEIPNSLRIVMTVARR